MEDKDLFILYNQYHGCWCPGDACRQGIRSYGVDLIHPKYSSLCTKRLYTTPSIKQNNKPELNLYNWFI